MRVLAPLPADSKPLVSFCRWIPWFRGLIRLARHPCLLAILDSWNGTGSRIRGSLPLSQDQWTPPHRRLPISAPSRAPTARSPWPRCTDLAVPATHAPRVCVRRRWHLMRWRALALSLLLLRFAVCGDGDGMSELAIWQCFGEVLGSVFSGQ